MSADITTGLVGYWTANGTANDSSTSHANGTLNGGATYANGARGKSFKFGNLAADFVNVPNVAGIQISHPCSVRFIVKRLGDSAGSILTKFNGATPMGFRVETSNHFYITEDGGNRLDIGAFVPFNKFVDVCLTIDLAGTTGTVFINGVNKGSAVFAGISGWFAATNALRFGAPEASFFGSGTTAAAVLLDEIRLYNRVLAAVDIKALTARDLSTLSSSHVTIPGTILPTVL